MNLIIVGCGPAGLMAAITAAKANPALNVHILEREDEPLRWMNDTRRPPALTRNDDDAALFAAATPRGAEFMHTAVQAFPPSQMRSFLEEAGIETKVLPNGAIVPAPGPVANKVSGRVLNYANRAGVHITRGVKVMEMNRTTDGFRLWAESGPSMDADYVILATGGRSGQAGWRMAQEFGHSTLPTVPSPVLLHTRDARAKTGGIIEVPGASAKLPEFNFEAKGGVNITQTGLGGGAILELTSRYSRELAQKEYKTLVIVNWAADKTEGQPTRLLRELQQAHARKVVADDPALNLPPKLWEKLIKGMKLPPQTYWSALSAAQLQTLAGQIVSSRFKTDARAMNKAEWVSCGGIPLEELDRYTLESLRVKGLYMAGEMIDVDALAGGWNMHSAWTTGWLAGASAAAKAAS